MKTIISENDSFVREASIQSIDALDGHFCLQIASVLRTARTPNATHRNFEAILDRDGLASLQSLLAPALNG